MINELGLEYAQALYDLSNNPQEEMDALDVLNEILKDEKIKKAIFHPSIEKDAKKKMFKDVFENRTSTLFINFIAVLIDNDRLMETENIYDSFKYLVDLNQGILNVEINCNAELNEEQLAIIFKYLKNKYQKNVIKHKFIKDESLIGGIRIKVGNDLIDATIDDQLLKMKEIVK